MLVRERDITIPVSVRHPDLAFRVFREVLADLPHEELWIACCDSRANVRSLTRVSQGGSHSTSLTPLDVLRPVVVSGCTAFILAHNHPSGDPTPSSDDYRMTRQVEDAAQVWGMTLLDHIVIGGNTFRSALGSGRSL